MTLISDLLTLPDAVYRDDFVLHLAEGVTDEHAAATLRDYVEHVAPPEYPIHLLAQQILALTLQEGESLLPDWRGGSARCPGSHNWASPTSPNPARGQLQHRVRFARDQRGHCAAEECATGVAVVRKTREFAAMRGSCSARVATTKIVNAGAPPGAAT